MLDTLVRAEDAADRTVVVQRIDQQSDIFAEVTVDVVRSAQQFRCLVDQVCCQDSVDDTFLVSLVKLIKTICKQTESSGSKDSFCFSSL